MKKSLLYLLPLLISALPLAAQEWSVSAGSGAFVFGDFMERTLAIAPPENPGSDRQTLTLTAATRAGLLVDLERNLGDRWALRLEGTFTRAPLSLGDSDDGFELDAGRMNVTTVALPIVYRINRGGAFRFFLKGGPAHAMYRLERDGSTSRPIFDETRSRWGLVGGAGVEWHLSDRFALEGQISDTVTSSPFEREDFVGADDPRLDIPRPHNVHTSVGVRWRF
jgi:opacity protein-like surface antigen